MEDDSTFLAQEPVAATISEEVRKSGLLSKIVRLSQSDKIALIDYLKHDIDVASPFQTDSNGQIKLSKEMREDVHRAQNDFEIGKCLTEESFKQRFAKWL